MCGISGVFHYGDARPADQAALRRMAGALAHRGPDDEGCLVDGPLGFAFRRLSIIDVAGGHQPILSPDEELAIVFNGEIYNFLELRRGLEGAGRRFSTNTDTEVILAAYERYGTACVDHLRGMFALAIWDRPARRLFLARDRLGIKPLYWYDDGRKLIFGSEIKAILAYDNDLDRQIDPEAVADYFSLRYVPAPKSIFRAVRKLEPGHVLSVEQGRRPRTDRYWDVRFEPDDERTEEEWIEGLRALLDDVVRMRLISEVPLGAFLSGGIDSSAVVATMSRLQDLPVSTHSVGFSESAFDERAAARMLATHYRTEHHEEEVTPDAVVAIEVLGRHFDEPFADASAVPTWYVSRMARKAVTVALSGDGGDENFAGYARRYAFERREDRVRRMLPDLLRRIVFGVPGRLYPKADRLPRFLRARTTLANLAVDAPEAFFNTMSIGEGSGPSPLLSRDLRNTLRGYRASDLFRSLMAASGTDDPVSRAQYVDLKTFLVDDILTKVDRASMAVSLEVRVPLLDHELVEYAARIPSGLKLKGREGKVVFKKAVEDRVPSDILRRRKQGFELPIAKWFRGPLRGFAEDWLLGRDEATGDLLDAAEVRRVWEDHQSGRKEGADVLWTVLMFRVWAARYRG